jgi:PAS domain S-box-containing protein
MLLVKLMLITAAAVQMAAAAVALRLVWLTGRRWAWGLLAAAILLMVARRGVPLYRVLTGDPSFSSDLGFELMGLVISLALLAGLIGMWPVFAALQRSRDFLRWQGRRLEALLQLERMADDPLRQMADFALREAVRLTHSDRGHLVFLNEDQSSGEWYSCSKSREALVDAGPTADDSTGAVVTRIASWQQSLEQRQTVIASEMLPVADSGNPALGSAAPQPVLHVPVLDGPRVAAVASVIGKRQPYDHSDSQHLTVLMQSLCRLIQRQQSARQSQRLAVILSAIRNVNQLISREREPSRLFGSACGAMVQEGAYHGAWIGQLDDSMRLVADWQAGTDVGCGAVSDAWREARWSELGRQLLADSQVVVVRHVACLAEEGLPGSEPPRMLLAVRLEYQGRVFGLLIAQPPADAAVDAQERSLLLELAGDLGLAMHSLELDQQRRAAEQSLQLEQSRLEALLKLGQMAEAELQTLTDYALEGAVRLTYSQIGYLAFLTEDESVLIMHSWSKTAMKECAIIDKPIEYPVVTTGLWGEAVRQRRPVITNEYAAPNPWKKGYPGGHVTVQRHMNVPIFDGERIVAVLGVGNKTDLYDESDVRQLTLLGQGMWQLLRRREAQEQLRHARDELELRVRVRTAELANANDELQQERYLLHTLMDNVPHSIYFKDQSSRFIRINQALARLFDLDDPLQAVGKTDADFFGPEHAQQALSDEQAIIRSGQPLVDREEKEVWPDGRVTWALTTKMPLRDPGGRIVGTFGISRDITGQRLAEESLRASELRYRTLYDASRDAIMMLDPQRGFLAGNPATIRLFGCRDEREFTACTPADLSPERQPDGASSRIKARQMIETALQEGVHFFEWQHQQADGTEFPATVLLTSMELEGRRILQATVRDISAEKHAAEALQAAKESAEAASRAKSSFLANMSHEIRTPLNAVIGMTELVLRSPLSAQQREYLSTVKDSGEALLSVINDILDFSKIEAGKLVLDHLPFDLRESLGDTMKSLAIRAHQKSLELAFYCHTDVPRRVLGDYARLRQVVLNLVSNAVKFTEQGEVVLEVNREAVEGRHVVLRMTVSDTGIGIPADKQADIFGMFEQGDSALTRRYGGTGLGLAIASRLVAMMGGSIAVDSQVGQGSRFQFTVRLELADPAESDDLVLVPSCLHGLRVLVVDDTATNRRILDEVLRHWHMEPELAAGAVQAMALLQAAHRAGSPYPLVLTDAHMPDVDGFTLTESLRKDPGLAATKVIMLTSGDRPEDMSHCADLGIAAYLLKPAKQSELLEAIEQTMGVLITKRDLTATLADLPAKRRLRILLAEDSMVNQKLAMALLEQQGHTVTIAINGREAVEAAERESFDLILMDVQMPEMDGLEATAAIRAWEVANGMHTPIIAMTAHALKGDRERCLEAGMDGYVAKPIRPKLLAEAIHVALGGCETQELQPAERVESRSSED